MPSFIQLALSEAGLNCVWPWHMSLINLLGKGDFEPHLICLWFPNLSFLLGTFFAVEKTLFFTLAKHETKQSHQIIHSNDKCYILTAVQQVLLTTAWFC